NKASAFKAFNRALVSNPRAAEVLAAKGVVALQKFEMKDAEQFADQALKINPNLVEALTLRADVYLAAGDAEEALKLLDKARAVNPRAEPTLARIGACLYLQNKEPELANLCKEVEKFDPKAGVFYHELAERLDERKRYSDA